MSNILKRLTEAAANKYIFPDAADLSILADEEPAAEEEDLPVDEETPEAPPEPDTPVDFAQIQAEAILQDARQEAEALLGNARQAMEEELEALRREARDEGYQQGFAEGMAGAMAEAKQQREQQAAVLQQEVRKFLEDAARERDVLLDQVKDELKELALTIAEKVIRISLRSSADILVRMIEAATARHRRCEWVQIYLADCDVRGSVSTVPELTEALRHLSDRVRIIPMADDESGTCIIEMPDEIIDASVSTQLDNIRDVLTSAEPDRDTERPFLR